MSTIVNAPVLELRDLVTDIDTPRGNVRAVDHVSLTIHAGETLGLVGESGSGKTMTALSIAGLLPPVASVTGGGIVLDGRDLRDVPARELRSVRADEVGVVFQNPMTALNPRLTIGRQLREALPVELRRSRRAARARAIELLAQVGIARAHERLGEYPHELSGGLSQRVVLAMAIARSPRLLIADEPTTALDVSIQAQVLDLVDELKREQQLGVLLVTHDIAVVAERAQRVAVMYAGQIVEEGDLDGVLERTAHRYTAGLLASAPAVATARHRPLVPIEGAPPVLLSLPVCCRFAPRCSAATDRCHTTSPTPVSDDRGHTYSCWHPADDDSVVVTEARVATEARVVEGDGRRVPVPVSIGGGAVRQPSIETGDPGAGAVPLLAAVDVHRAFPVPGGGLGHQLTRKALAGATVELHAGQSLGIVGESGCGKSTLARLLVGLDRPDAGTIRYQGADLATLRGGPRRDWRRSVQLVFQDPYGSLDPRLTAAAIIREPLQLQGGRLGRKELDRRVDDLLDEVGLPRAIGGRRPAELSGGQRQRVGIARALALDPQVLVADEPVSALDVSVQATVLNLLRRLRAERNLTLVVISHDLGVIRYLCDDLVVMYLGRIVESGRTEAVYAQPRHPYTAALLNCIPGAPKDPALHLEGEVPSAVDPPSGCRFRTRCPFVHDRCALETPLLEPLPGFEGGHHVACHTPRDAAGEPSALLSAAGRAI